MASDLSLVRYNVTAFFSIILNSRPFIPIFTQQYKIVDALIRSESPPSETHIKKLQKIYSQTHDKVNVSLPIIELVVFKNLDKGLNREVEIGAKQFPLSDLYRYLDEVSLELSQIVVEIAKKYSFDIPIIMNRTSTGISIDG